jgi:hypothetical protein
MVTVTEILMIYCRQSDLSLLKYRGRPDHFEQGNKEMA